jgi:hypothetical protein
MKRIFILSALFVCLLALSYSGCSGDNPFDVTVTLPIGKVQAINIIPGILWIGIGDIYRFEARGIFPGGAIGDVTFLASWSSDNPDVAPIIGPGLVRADMPGLAYVTCTYDGVTSSAGTVAVPGEPLEFGIVPIHVQIIPGSLNIPVFDNGLLTFVPTRATPYEMSLTFPKPAELYLLGDADKDVPAGYWAGGTLRITGGAAAGLEFTVLNSYTSPNDTIPGDVDYPYGHDWIPDGIAVYEIDDDQGFPLDWGVAAGDAYEITKRSFQFQAVADYSDGSQKDVTSAARWHISDPTQGIITSSGLFRSTSGEPANLVIYCDFSGLVSNYVPISVRP